jgi:hypothetical protein
VWLLFFSDGHVIEVFEGVSVYVFCETRVGMFGGIFLGSWTFFYLYFAQLHWGSSYLRLLPSANKNLVLMFHRVSAFAG